MTRQEKIAYLDKLEEELQAFNSLRQIVFYCTDCRFKISVIDRKEPYISCQVGFHYEYDETTKKYEKIEHINKRINHSLYLGAPANHICLTCGNALLFSIRKKEKKCDNCKGNKIVFWKEIAGKTCPICSGKFADEVVFKTQKEYNEASWDEDGKTLLEAQEKYGKIETKLFSKTNIQQREDEYLLVERYMSSRFVVENNHNFIKFSCMRSFQFPFNIIAEWDKNSDVGKLIFCSLEFSNEFDVYKEMILEKEKIDRLLRVLDNYNFFSKSNESDRLGLDGSTWSLEVSIGDLYKEISIWSPNEGVIYDIGHLLFEYSNPKINGKFY